MSSITPSEATIREACRLASAQHPGIGVDEIRGTAKQRAIVRARWTAWRILAERGYPYAGIGRRWPCDHTTIVHAMQRLEAA